MMVATKDPVADASELPIDVSDEGVSEVLPLEWNSVQTEGHCDIRKNIDNHSAQKEGHSDVCEVPTDLDGADYEWVLSCENSAPMDKAAASPLFKFVKRQSSSRCTFFFPEKQGFFLLNKNPARLKLTGKKEEKEGKERRKKKRRSQCSCSGDSSMDSGSRK